MNIRVFALNKENSDSTSYDIILKYHTNRKPPPIENLNEELFVH